MQYEISSGAVVFTRRENRPYYVIVKSPEGFYGFPKGHIENGESEHEAALREIFEETGLRPTLLDGFRTVDEHAIPSKPDVIKRIIYFLGEYEAQEIRLQEEELIDAALMPFEEAMAAFQFESSRRILREAHEFLTK